MLVGLFGGLLLLVVGAEALVRGGARLASAAGLSPLVVGLTVVAFGTSAPEVAVGIGASITGQGGVALGNVVGSNIFNVLLILGIAALIAPLAITKQLVQWDVPLGIGIAGLVLVLALDGTVGRFEGLLLFGGLVAYTTYLVVQARRHPSVAVASGAPVTVPRTVTGWLLCGGLVIGGLALLVVGARWFVDGAVEGALRLGVSETIVGLTIVAGGTSLPELATSVLAAVRGEREIAVGNVLGSNLFNLLGVLGLSALLSPEGLPVSDAILWFDLPVMIAVAVACLPIFVSGSRIDRWEGLTFLFFYAAYVTYLILAAAQHEALSTFGWAMIAFVLPLTIVTLLVVAVRSGRGASLAGDEDMQSGR